MSKATVTRLFIGAGVAIIAGAILGIVAVSIAIANSTFILNGSDIVGLRGSLLGWSSVGLGVVGVVSIAGGLIAGIVAWVGALVNTWQIESKAWFIGLLLLGIFNLGFFAMVAYVLAGPEGPTNTATGTAHPAPRATPA